MARDRTTDWRSIRASRPLNEARGVTLRRLIDAEAALHLRHERLGARQSLLGDILEQREPRTCEAVEDLYLATVSEYVAALGGHIEVRAIFPDEQVRLLREPSAVA